MPDVRSPNRARDPKERAMTERQDSQPAAGGEQPTESDDVVATEKPGGLGDDGTIPAAPDGVAAGHTGTASTFEPEEDEEV